MYNMVMNVSQVCYVTFMSTGEVTMNYLQAIGMMAVIGGIPATVMMGFTLWLYRNV